MAALQFLQDEKRNKTKTNVIEAGNFRALPRGGSRNEEVIELCEAMQDVLAACFSVSGKEIRSQDRCRSEISRIRQIGMYVTHVVVGLTMLEVGRGFQRDRSTVAHACHVIEDMRDDPDSERIIHMVEKIAEIAFLRTAR